MGRCLERVPLGKCRGSPRGCLVPAAVPPELPAKYRFANERLRRVREAQGWTREDVATRLRCSVSLVAAVELGYRKVSAERAALFAAVYGARLDDLIDPVDEPEAVAR
jgi:ribosome-binding protein aMBF1 (putative translation factor)